MSDTEPFAYGTQATTRQSHRRFQWFRKPRGAIGSAQKAAYLLTKKALSRSWQADGQRRKARKIRRKER
ncbi:MAG: hypothetical protein RR843_03370 [Clostridia bacterium]